MADSAEAIERRSVAAPGLAAPVEIVVDRWGIPHIYAASAHDAFFAQGWNAARDRLWQMDLWRKRGLGLLAENFGPDYVAQDRAARLFLYRGDMEAEWAVYGPDAKATSEAWVAGLNAYVRQVVAGEAPLPVEFELTGTKPSLWALEDHVRIRSHGISNNAESETLRVRVAAAGSLDADRIRRKLDPDHTPILPEGLDPADVPADILADYTLATKEVTFGQAPPAPTASESAEAAASQGSNNWVVAPSRSATGRPILASDPHRVLIAPSIRYLVHLDAPELKVMGAGELHLPGVTIGHNETIAFAITVFMADQADLYVYELNPDDPNQYRYGEGWEDLTVLKETLAVKGEAPREVELAFTRHGPVLKHLPEAGRAFALRTIWSEPGTSSYFCASRYQTAGDWATFKDALSHWGAAPMNFVYADVEGNIGWIPAGFLPRRRNWDGLTGAPGDGRYEWDGFASQDELPTLYNPDQGWIGTANEMNIPLDHPAQALNLGFEWADPCRMERIAEVLSASDQMTVQDCAALQIDVVSGSARRGVELLKGLESPDPRVQAALERLAVWDGVETLQSAPAAIAEVWLSKHLAPAVARRITTPQAAEIIGFGAPYAVVTYLQTLSAALGDDPGATRDEVLLESLASALDELTARLGPDMDAWTWGALHHAHFVPPVAALADETLRAKMGHGPAPMPGSAFTVCAATYRMDDFAMTNGASVRMVVDVGAWDESLVINTPGQSGDSASPHYGDMFPLWARGEYVPMLWTREAVDAAAEQVIRLTPGAAAETE
jgi:penicillin amidase